VSDDLPAWRWLVIGTALVLALLGLAARAEWAADEAARVEWTR
jgi:hypothetical protein